MQAPPGREEELEKLELQMGVPRGRLALALGLLTDSLVLAAQHGVYCQSSRQPGMPKMDVQLIVRSLEEAKGLIQEVMADLKRD